jgi:hypothetical protein
VIIVKKKKEEESIYKIMYGVNEHEILSILLKNVIKEKE